MQNPGFVLRAVLLSMAMVGLAACEDTDDGGPDGGPVVPMTPGDTFVITSSAAGQRVLSFNRATPGSMRTAVAVSGLNPGERIVGADFRPADGNVYALTSASRVLRLDRTTGVASAPVSLSVPLDPAATDFGVDFNPVPDRLRVVSNTGNNLRINVVSGETTLDSTLKLDRRTPTTTDATGITAAAYTMNFPQACRTTLYYLNSASGSLLTSADPNGGTVFTVGSLGVAPSTAVNGFDVLTGTAGDGSPTNTGVAILATGGVPTLFTVNLTTGAATSNGAVAVGAGEQIVSLLTPIAASPTKQARGEVAAQTASNKLITFNRGSPAKLCTGPTAITGLGGAENLVGLDTRPATAELYGLTDGSRLVVINPDTAVATERSVLSTALPGSEVFFGIDFNPVPDLLRVITGSGVNLRIDPRAGVTPNVTTDTPLSGASSANVNAVAYANSLNGGAENTNTGSATTLFGIDSARNMLVRIGGDPASGGVCPGATGSPNCGVVADVGPLGVDVEATNGFEIDGVSGEGLLAAFTPGSLTARLFRVDLATGAATLIATTDAPSTIGGATGEHIRGFALLPVQTARVFALLEGGVSLVDFPPSSPGAPSTARAITGLAGGETLLDIDFRVTGNPLRNRQLVGLSSESRLYTIDPETGVASNGHKLKDAGGVDVVVAGTLTAVDFNPVADLLRVITPTQNLRINVDSTTAGTSADPVVTGATNLFGAAYANNYVTLSPRTPSTTLYAISGVTANLVRIGGDPSTGGDCPGAVGNPNCGVATFIGGFGAAAPAPLSGLGDMDIVGGRNGYALAAVQPAAGGGSTLIRINLATGAATSLGAIATASPVRSIAVRVQ